jgi:hypothetical protein
MRRKNTIAFLALSAVPISVLSRPVSAQTGNVSIVAPKPAQTNPVHKPKIAPHPKKQNPDLEAEQKPGPATIPMDFSGMARRPVDLPSESESSKPRPNEAFKPAIGTNSNGGISPGMNMKF